MAQHTSKNTNRRPMIRWQFLAGLGILVFAVALGLNQYQQLMSPVFEKQTTEARETELIATYRSFDLTATDWTTPLAETANAHFAPDLTAWAENPPADLLEQTPTIFVFEVTRSAYIDQLKTQIATTPEATQKP